MAENANIGVINPDAIWTYRIQWRLTLGYVREVCVAAEVGDFFRCDIRVTSMRELHKRGTGSHCYQELASMPGSANRKNIHDYGLYQT